MFTQYVFTDESSPLRLLEVIDNAIFSLVNEGLTAPRGT
ncbi:hypothetical protein AVJ25_03720, partial [Yersinia pestis]